MITEIIEQWEQNKSKLKNYFETTTQNEYNEYKIILEKTFELCFKEYDHKKITEIDNGDYQGTLIFLIPENTYQPSERNYLFTSVYYGSCSSCDTLQGIICDGDNYDELPNEKQVTEYMTLALHMVQKLKKLDESEEEDY
jgi:hypothetical protein